MLGAAARSLSSRPDSKNCHDPPAAPSSATSAILLEEREAPGRPERPNRSARFSKRVDGPVGAGLRPVDVLISLVDDCDDLLEEARKAGDEKKIQRLERIRNEATIELAEHARRFALGD